MALPPYDWKTDPYKVKEDPSARRDREHYPEELPESTPYNPFDGTGFDTTYQEWDKDGRCTDYTHTRDRYIPKPGDEDEN